MLNTDQSLCDEIYNRFILYLDFDSGTSSLRRRSFWVLGCVMESSLLVRWEYAFINYSHRSRL